MYRCRSLGSGEGGGLAQVMLGRPERASCIGGSRVGSFLKSVYLAVFS